MSSYKNERKLYVIFQNVGYELNRFFFVFFLAFAMLYGAYEKASA